jgi:hypothetical protein
MEVAGNAGLFLSRRFLCLSVRREAPQNPLVLKNIFYYGDFNLFLKKP